MLTDQIVAMLVAERDRLNRAIEVLGGSTIHRGRPAKKAAGPVAAAGLPVQPNGSKRRGMSAAKRKAQSERMKAYWAAKRKAKK
jgi:hypothetical protein